MENLNDVTDAFEGWEIEVTIYKSVSGGYVNGLWVESEDPGEVTINAVVQNANPDDLKVVPEGLRTREAIKLHTRSVLKTVDEVGETRADIVLYDGAKWRVYSVANRKIGGYYKAVAVRIKENVN